MASLALTLTRFKEASFLLKTCLSELLPCAWNVPRKIYSSNSVFILFYYYDFLDFLYPLMKSTDLESTIAFFLVKVAFANYISVIAFLLMILLMKN